MSKKEHLEVTPMNYLKIFFRRKEMLIIPAFIGIIVGVCLGIILPKQYEATTTLLVEEGKTDNPLFDKLTVSTTVQERIMTIKESMLGWHSLVKLVKRLGMDKDIKNQKEFEDLILGIRNNMKIKLKAHNIIELSFFGENPELTRDVVRTITEIFIERNVDIQNKETQDAITFIEEQLKVYKGKIRSSEIAKLKDELKVLLVDSTENHPRVKQLREQIEAKEQELRADNLEYTENVAVDEQTNNPIIDEIKKALENIEGGTTVNLTGSKDPEKEYYKVMLKDKLDGALARDADVNATIYNMLLQRLETAKITKRLQSSEEGTKYTVLDPPRIPLSPKKPNKILVALAGLLGGIVLGMGLIFTVEFLDKSFIDVEEAKQYFGVPLLGAISRINTPLDVRIEREKSAWLYALTIIGGVIAVILTQALSNFIK